MAVRPQHQATAALLAHTVQTPVQRRQGKRRRRRYHATAASSVVLPIDDAYHAAAVGAIRHSDYSLTQFSRHLQTSLTATGLSESMNHERGLDWKAQSSLTHSVTFLMDNWKLLANGSSEFAPVDAYAMSDTCPFFLLSFVRSFFRCVTRAQHWAVVEAIGGMCIGP